MNEKPTVDLILHSASQLLTLEGGPQRGIGLGELGIIPDGALAVRGESIVAVGPSQTIRDSYLPRRQMDCSHRVVMPGFVDPHTHLIWSGDRAAEFEMRVAGATYMEIMAAGGGIASTVKQTRASTLDELVAEALQNFPQQRYLPKCRCQSDQIPRRCAKRANTSGDALGV